MSQTAWDARGHGGRDRTRTLARRAVRSDEDGDARLRVEFRTAWTLHVRAVSDRCAFLMGGRGADADEAVSRAALTALRKYAAHRHHIQDVRKWLLGIARNACMDVYRERAREARLCPTRLADVPEDPGARLRGESPEQRLLAEERLAVLRRAVEALPTRLREPLRMRLRELSDRDIASALGLRATTVRKRLQEARDALRPVMAAYREGVGRAHHRDEPDAAPHIGGAANV